MTKTTKSGREKTNLSIAPRIKHPAIQLANDYEWSLSELVERLLEKELLAQGMIQTPLRSSPLFPI